MTTGTTVTVNRYGKVKSGEKYHLAFLIAFLASALMLLPFVIYDEGYFLFFGDFNVQQVPFYQLAHEAIRSGDIFWNWYTDLGVNFIGSYSFYLLFSPFFWLTLPLPTAWVPYMMAPLLALKFGVISLTGYTFITRFVKNKNAALIGALLYSFSGFSIYNIFFNHFHEVLAFFPLLLVGLEEMVYNNRRGVFALAVGLNLAVNYFFFVGQVVFLVIYFVIRLVSDKSFRINFPKFFWLGFESLLGVGLAMFLFLPSMLAISDNPRLDNMLSGWSMLLYSSEQRYPAILQSFLFPPDLPSRPNFLPDANAKWSSMAGWFPLLSLSGVIAFLSAKPKHWVRRIIITCAVMACVPFLNSAFFAFNSAYYARWYYMPILIMALATAKAIEDESVDYMKGIRWTMGLTLVFTLIGVTPIKKNGEWTFGLETYPDRFWLYVGLALICILMTYLLFKYLRKSPNFYRMTVFTLVVCFIAGGCVYVGLGKGHSYNDQWIINTGIEGRDKISLTDDDFYRVDVYEGMDNQAMFWHMPTIQAFHSIVPASVMEFYPTVGVERGVGSRPEPQYYGVRALTSTKYLFIDTKKEEYSVLPGFSYYSTQNGFDIYLNDYFVPMGFTYDYAVTRDEYNSVSERYRHLAILRAMVLEEEDLLKYGDYIESYGEMLSDRFDEEGYYRDCADLADTSCYYFERDNLGFTGKINLEQNRLVFFSVPYDKGWTATVNGEPTEIIKANVGFMAVKANAGENEIRFEYRTPGLKLGILISLGCAIVLALYMLVYYFVNRRRSYRISAEMLATEELEQQKVPEEPVQENDGYLVLDDVEIEYESNDNSDSELPIEIAEEDAMEETAETEPIETDESASEEQGEEEDRI